MGKLIMTEIIELEPIRLSRMEEQELVVVAIEKAAQQLIDHTALLKELTKRIEKVEESIEDIYITLNAT